MIGALVVHGGMDVSEDRFIVREARRDDLDSVLHVQHQAFGRVVAQFGVDPQSMPPICETADELRRLWESGMRFFVAATSSGQIVGSVRGVDRGGVVEVGRLVVADAWLRRGVATRLMDSLEAAFPTAVSFVLFTATVASEPLALYSQRGYVPVREETQGSFTIVWLEKILP